MKRRSRRRPEAWRSDGSTTDRVRNLAVAAGNAPYGEKLVGLLRQRRIDADEMVAEHIDWALARQASRKAMPRFTAL